MDRREALVTTFGAVTGGLLSSPDAQADHPSAIKNGANPCSQLHLYLCAFHIAKKDPKLVFEAHHYCMAIADELHQLQGGSGRQLQGLEHLKPKTLTRGADREGDWRPNVALDGHRVHGIVAVGAIHEAILDRKFFLLPACCNRGGFGGEVEDEIFEHHALADRIRT